MAKKKRKKRGGGGYSLGSIWDLSTQLMDQQLGPERAATTDQFRRDLATLQGSMNSFNSGSNMAQRSIDEVQNQATAQAAANANTAMSGMNSMALASRDAMAPWVASTNAFIGGQGAPDLAMNEVTNMGMGSPVSFLMEAGPVAAAAAGEAHDVALNQKHDQEILQDQIDNQKNQIQGNINEPHNAYRDKMAGLMGSPRVEARGLRELPEPPAPAQAGRREDEPGLESHERRPRPGRRRGEPEADRRGEEDEGQADEGAHDGGQEHEGRHRRAAEVDPH